MGRKDSRMEELQFVHVELKRDTWVSPKMSIRDPFDAVEVARALIEDLDREMVINIHLATDGRVINATICSIGTMNSANVSPKEVLRTAIVSGAHSIIMIHNHPSGSCQPSRSDLQVAKELATACDLIGLELKDFIVIGAYGYRHSVKEQEFEWLEPSYKWLQEV